MAQAFETIKSFISRIKELMPDAHSVRCLFDQFMINKFGKITIKPVFVIVDNAKIDFAELNICPNVWINTSKSQEALQLDHKNTYELFISTTSKQYENLSYYPHSIKQIQNESVSAKIRSASENDLSRILD